MASSPLFARKGDWPKALAVYRWFTPLLHLDVHVKFVQYIKLCVQECGLGKEWTRAPRLPLVGKEREEVLNGVPVSGGQSRAVLRMIMPNVPVAGIAKNGDSANVELRVNDVQSTKTGSSA